MTMFPCAPFSDIQALKQEFTNLYIPAIVNVCITILCLGHISNKINDIPSIWKKLLFFPRKVTYFVLTTQIWIPYEQNSIFSFV